jgi:hypothetical protein
MKKISEAGQKNFNSLVKSRGIRAEQPAAEFDLSNFSAEEQYYIKKKTRELRYTIIVKIAFIIIFIVVLINAMTS